MAEAPLDIRLSAGRRSFPAPPPAADDPFLRDHWLPVTDAETWEDRRHSRRGGPGRVEAIPNGFVPDTVPRNFPTGAAWAVTEEHAESWLRHGFWGMRGDSEFSRRLSDLADDELALLLWDLDCYVGLARRWQARNGLLDAPDREPLLPHISDYLRPGREHWGSLMLLVEEWMEWGGG